MLSKFFIDRPIFASVLAIVMVIAGGLSAYVISVEQYPEIAPPTVSVDAVYPGANAQTVAETVAAPIEQEVNGVEGMIYMSSVSADDGTYALTVSFELGTDIDIAAVQTQNRVSAAEAKLPSEVRAQGITTKKKSPSLLMVLAPYAPGGEYDNLFLSNYVNIYMKDAISRTNGVGDVFIFGVQDFSMRVWLDPLVLAARGLTTLDVIDAIQAQNVQVAAGRIGAEPIDDPAGFQFTVSTQGRLSTPEEFGAIVVKVGEDQRTVRLSDVARIERGAASYDMVAGYNGARNPLIGIYQLPGTNALAVAETIKHTVQDLSEDFPDGMECPVVYDSTIFVSASIKEVITTLVIASLLVFATVFVFLQDWRATLVPGVAIPVSIIGTFAILLALGYSMNMLTLFGLVLAIGIVVDDAIVVVENTARLIDEEGLDPKSAAKKSMMEITGPVIATSLVLLAVFVPTTVLPGITGQLYRQFGVTLSVATLLSSVNALTLSPALCALLLRKTPEKRNILFRALNVGIDGTRRVYSGTVRILLRVAILGVLAFALVVAGVVWSFKAVPGGFLPNEDQAYMFVNISAPDAAKLGRTIKVMEEVQEIVANTEGVESYVSIGGFSILTGAAQSNSATLIVVLDPWELRPDRPDTVIAAEMSRKFYAITEATVFPFLPPPIQGLGSAGGFDMRIQDRGSAGSVLLQSVANDIVAAASETGKIVSPYNSFSAETPQIFVDINRDRAQRLGIALPTIFDTLQTNLGSAYVNDFNLFGRTFQVRAQAESEFRMSQQDLLDLKVRNAEGSEVPISTLATVRETAGPAVVYRYNLFSAATITGSGAPGVSSGQALSEMQQIADQTLPPGFGFEWTSLAYQQIASGNLAPLVFALAIVFVYFFLAAQYESWSVPLTIMATIPIGVLGAMLATLARGMDNNVYTQIGLVLLVALVCKNAILIVEFAEQLRKQGKPLREATLEASSLRYRPILMTALSFVLGTAPLLIASGAGASSRLAIGTAVFGGMVLATFVGIFFIPVMYLIVRTVFKGKRIEAAA